MSRAVELSFIIGATTTGAMAGFAKVSKALKEVKDNTENLVRASTKLEKMDKASKKMIELNKAYSEASKKLKMLQEAQKKAGTSGSLFNEQIKKQERILNDLNRQKERQKHVFEAARSSIEKEGYALRGYKESLEKVNKELKINNKLKEIQAIHEKRMEVLNKAQQHGDTLLRRGVVAGALTLAPLKIYMDVEESQADLRKILGKEAELYYDKLAEISKKSPLSQIDLNEIAGALSQGGIRGNEIVKYTDMAQKMKVAFDMSTQEAGEFLAKTREQLNLVGKEGTEQLFSYMDTINMLSNKYPVHAADLADISLRTAGYAKNIGLAKEANLGFATALQSTLKSSEQTSTVLSKLYSELAQGANTKAKASALQFLGINPSSLEKEMAKDAEGTILKVLERIKNANLADKAGLIGDIFGNNASTQNGIAVLTNNLDGLKQKLNEAKQAVGENDSVTAEYNERIKTISSQLKIAKNNFMLGLADVGASLAPLAKGFLETITPMLKRLADFIKQNPKLVSGLMKAIGAFALFNLGLGGSLKFGIPFIKTVLGVVNVFSKLNAAGGLVAGFSKVFPKLSKFGNILAPLGKNLVGVFSKGGISILKLLNPVNAVKMALRGLKLGAASSVNILKLLLNPFKLLKSAIGIIKSVGLAIKLAFMANPIGFLIGAIAGLIAIFVILYTKSTWFKNGVNNAIKQIMPHVKELGRLIKQGIGQAISWVSSKMKQAGPHMRNAWNSLKPVLSAIGTILKVIIVVAIRLVISTIKALMANFKFLATVAGGVFKMISSSIKMAIEIWKGIFKLFVAFFTGKWNEIPGIVSGVWESVKSGISGFVEGAKGILKGLFDWFGTQWGNIKKMAGDLGNALNPANWGGKVPGKYTGTNYWEGGLVRVGERGAEMIKVPGQSPFIAQSEMLMNLPKGTEILNASRTKNTLRERVNRIKERASNLGSGGSTVVGGDTINITINAGSNSNANDIAREVKRILAEMKNKKERVAFG